jgi:FG-GAP-like repeat
VAADFNRDGKLDLAVANGNAVSILLRNGNGTFGPATNYAVAAEPVGLAVGDFNNDGRFDLAVAGRPNATSIMFGKGDGTFPVSHTYVPGGKRCRGRLQW